MKPRVSFWILSEYADNVLILTPETPRAWARPYGDVLTAEKLWSELGLRASLYSLASLPRSWPISLGSETNP